MPWLEASPEMERMKFITWVAEEEENFSELCRRFGISRQTGYVWKQRFEEGGAAALADRPPCAKRHPNLTPVDVEDAVVNLRKLHPTWGPKKLRAWLAERRPELALPAPSTMGDILTRRGLTAPRKRRLRVPPSPTELQEATCANAVWTTDHKGHFPLSSGRCHPLTLMDSWSRYFLKCEALLSTSEEAARPHYEAAFREFGLPARIRTDNGVPFAHAHALGQLSRLSVWWVKLGIELERVDPGCPQQNGKHERMHRTLKDVIDGPCDLAEQQRRFDVFRAEWNHERPHEGIGLRCPGRLYETSWRPYPEVLCPLEYPSTMQVRTVAPSGSVKWCGHYLSVGKTLAGERVGFEEFDENLWIVRFGPVVLGEVELRDAAPRFRRRPCSARRQRRLRCLPTPARAASGGELGRVRDGASVDGRRRRTAPLLRCSAALRSAGTRDQLGWGAVSATRPEVAPHQGPFPVGPCAASVDGPRR